MTEVYIATFLLAVTFLLICWVVTEFQIYEDSHSLEDELNRPRMSSRFAAWRNRLFEVMDKAKYFRQESLKEANRTTFLFGIKRRDKKEESRLAGRTR